MALPDSLGKLLLELLAARGAFANVARSPCYMQTNIPRLWTGLWWVKPIFVVPLGWGGHTLEPIMRTWMDWEIKTNSEQTYKDIKATVIHAASSRILQCHSQELIKQLRNDTTNKHVSNFNPTWVPLM